MDFLLIFIERIRQRLPMFRHRVRHIGFRPIGRDHVRRLKRAPCVVRNNGNPVHHRMHALDPTHAQRIARIIIRGGCTALMGVQLYRCVQHARQFKIDTVILRTR